MRTSRDLSSPVQPRPPRSAGKGTALAAVVIGVVALATACGGSSSNAASVSSPASSSSQATGSSKSTAASADAGSDLANRLLSAAEIDPSFTEQTWTASHDPLPCTPSAPDPDTTVSQTQLIGTVLDAPDRKLNLQEEVRAFGNADQAKAWYSLVEQGFGCAQGELAPGITITITGPQDVTADLGTDQATDWQLATGASQMELVVARKENGVALFLFTAGTGADTSGIPKPVVLAKKGIDKLG